MGPRFLDRNGRRELRSRPDAERRESARAVHASFPSRRRNDRPVDGRDLGRAGGARPCAGRGSRPAFRLPVLPGNGPFHARPGPAALRQHAARMGGEAGGGMSTIRIEDVAFVRFRAPGLGEMRKFLDDFGLVVVEVAADRLVARGSGPAPVTHITERGDPGFAAVGFRAASVADLETLARSEGAPVQDFDAPGGGRCVVLIDPDGHRIEIVAGHTPAEPLALPQAQPWNRADQRTRLRAIKRIASGAANVVRLGHVVLNVSNFRASKQWYKDRFGFITSDEIALSPAFSIGAFLRCDRGDTATD